MTTYNTLSKDTGQLHGESPRPVVLYNPDGTPVNPVDGTPAQDGTDGTGITPPTGATGIRGWLSGLYQLLSGSLKIIGQLPSAVVCGQTKIATTNTAVALPSAVNANGFVIKASKSNTADICIGTSAVITTEDGTGNGYYLSPGEAISFAVANLNSIYVNGTAGDWVCYAGN